MLDSKRDSIQNAAVETWEQAGKKGTLNLSTGIGKTFCFIKATRLLPKGSKILFLAETSQREIDLEKDIKFFKKLFKYDLRKEHELTFMCYQSAYKLKDTEWDFSDEDMVELKVGNTILVLTRDELNDFIESWDEKEKFALEAIGLRIDPKTQTISVSELLEPTRKEDQGDDLWSIYNVVQEKLIHGMYNYANGEKVRKSRPIKNFQQNMKVNSDLYKLALQYA